MLIAAVFCLCNRYVDGLATWAPDDPAFYRQRAAIVAEAWLCCLGGDRVLNVQRTSGAT